MPCTVTVDGPCRRTLSFAIDRTNLDQEIEAKVSEIAASASLKGFRKGKAPIELIRRTHGKTVAEEARRKVMSEAFRDAVQEHELRPVGDPVMNLEKLDEGEGDFTFEFEVEVAPDIEVEIPDRFEANVVLAKVSDEMVASDLKRARERFAQLEDGAEGEAAGDDDILECTVTYTVDGEQIATRSSRPVYLRHEMVDGLVIEGSREVFTGSATGDLITLQTTLPEHFQPEGWADREASVEVSVEKLRKLIVPDELDDEQLKSLGTESMEDLTDKIRQGLDQQRAQARFQQIDHAIEETLLGGHEFELPERLIAKTIDRKLHELAHEMMKQQGLSSEVGHQAAENRRDEVVEVSTRGLRLAFIFDAIATLKELKAGAEETIEQVKSLAQQQGADPDEALQAAVQEGWLGDVAEQLTTEKVRAFLRDRVDVNEREPDPVDGEAAADGAESTEAAADEDA